MPRDAAIVAFAPRPVARDASGLSASRTISRAIAKRGYGGAVTTDHDQQAQAVGLFLTDALLQICQTIVEAVGPFISDTSTAPADLRPNDQLRRNATALPLHVTMSHTPLHRHSAAGK
jgi:hypothetical protein